MQKQDNCEIEKNSSSNHEINEETKSNQQDENKPESMDLKKDKSSLISVEQFALQFGCK